MAKKTNIADTSIKAYYEIEAEGLITREKALVQKIFDNTPLPLTNRDVMNITKKERSNVCRILYDLVNENKIYKSHKASCAITGRTVYYYMAVRPERND